MTIILNGTTGVTFPNGVTMSDGTSAPVTVAQGGTGANTAANARTALGLAIGTDVLAPNGSGANLTSLNATALASGTVPDARFPATLPAASGANLTSLNASSISSGTVATARLASGTANSTTYLRGDQTWASVSGGVTSLNGQTGAITNTSLNAIGSIILARVQSTVNLGDTLSASSMYWYNTAGCGSYVVFTGYISGTWRLLGASTGDGSPPRISGGGSGYFMRVS